MLDLCIRFINEGYVDAELMEAFPQIRFNSGWEWYADSEELTILTNVEELNESAKNFAYINILYYFYYPNERSHEDGKKLMELYHKFTNV